MKNLEFKIDGMKCAGCSGGVAGTLKSTTGINSVEVSHESKLAKVEFDENIITENDIFQIVKDMNYVPSNI